MRFTSRIEYNKARIAQQPVKSVPIKKTAPKLRERWPFLNNPNVPVELQAEVADFLPFASNMIRCVAGFICFTSWLLLSGQASRFKESVHNSKGLKAMMLAVMSGPLIGVGFSIMALQYTAAGIASTIMAMTPILILMPSRWLFKQPVTLRSVVGAVISVVGVSLFFLL
jgi:drug/metabolite transporter (DMT)-like permease